MLNSEVEPLVQKSLKNNEKDPKGNMLPGMDFRFIKTDFGSVPPKISNMRTHKAETDNMDGDTAKSIVIDFDVEYQGDCNIQVELMGISSGVR